MTPGIPDFEMTQRLLLSAGVGAILGLEREWRHKNAGLRTQILIALGSTVFTLMSYRACRGRARVRIREALRLRSSQVSDFSELGRSCAPTAAFRA